MNSAVARDTWQGKVVNGRFPLLEWLGGSDRSTVFRTEIAGGKAALKLIPVQNAGPVDEQIAQWKLISTLSHPHLLAIYDAGVCSLQGSQFLYVVMEFADEDLSQVLPVRPLSTQEAREMLSPVISALWFLHGQNLVHSAIKPTNIMAIENQLKISSDRVRRLTAPKVTKRDLQPFDAPEAVRGLYSPASDVWSLGGTLAAALGQQIEFKTNGSDPELQINLPEPFRQIARECLRRNPGERCTLQQIKARLEPATPAEMPVAAPPRKRGSSRVAIMALLCAAVLVAGLLILRGGKRPPANPSEPQTSTTGKQAPAATTAAVPQVSGPPRVVERNIPNVPLSARNTVQGKVRVIVRVDVNTAGEVAEATLVSPGPSRYFARLAVESARRWKFEPRNSRSATTSAWRLTYLFGRSGTEVYPAPANP